MARVVRGYDALPALEARVVLFLGGGDSGKTTLAAEMARRECSRRKIALLDIDVGQSHIGPPSTIAWAPCRGRFPGFERLPVGGLYFTGDISPARSIRACLRGAGLMFAEASRNCPRIIIDTDGYVEGGGAVAYKTALIRSIRPDCVVACGGRADLSPILEKIAPALLIMTRPQEGAHPKSSARRAAYRCARFRDYFSCPRVRYFPRRLFHPGLPGEGIRGLLAGLVRPDGSHSAVGVILGDARGRIPVLVPRSAVRPVASVITGSARLPDGILELPVF
ncbi:MAG: Clp1/GlmU family protein [Deltaproteobacteria bacterium]